MATKAWISKQKRREELVARYAQIRRDLKKQKNFAALAKLPRDSSPRARTFAVSSRDVPGAICASSRSPASCSESWRWRERSLD